MPSKVSREYSLQWDKTPQHPPLLTIIGGKITTYRKLAEEVWDTWTAHSPLPGGDFAQFFERCHEQYAWLPISLCERYAHQYGTRIHQVLENTHSLADLGIEFGHGLYAREISFLVQQEWAMTAEDILWRRTKLGIVFNENERQALEKYLLGTHIP